MIRKLRTVLLAAATCCAATPALATGGIYCDGARDDNVAAFLTVGRVPGLAVVEARIGVGDQDWAMHGRDGATPIVLLQGAVVGDLTVADFGDTNYENVVASLRLVSAEDEDGLLVAGGTLSIRGVGAWPVVCQIE